jgi:hypothetical protein
VKHTAIALSTLVLLLAACQQPASPPPGGKAEGLVIGSTFDGAPLTVGKGDMQGKAVVITYFATW